MRIMLFLMLLLLLHPHAVILETKQLARLHGPRDRHPDALLEGMRERIVLSKSMADDENAGNDKDEDRDDGEHPAEVGRPLGVVVAAENECNFV